MKRHDYRTALRAKGIKPIPGYAKLRVTDAPAGAVTITASEPRSVKA